MEVAPQLKDSLNRNFFDLLSTFRQIHGDSVQNQLVLQHVEIPQYLTLYSPAIHWILQCVAYRAPDVRSAHQWGGVVGSITKVVAGYCWVPSLLCHASCSLCADALVQIDSGHWGSNQ